MSEPTPWHKLFGLSLIDFFRDTPVSVETEKDLSLRKQLLDVVLVRTDAAALPRRLPDGFEELGSHNLITFKSYQEALDGWSLNELVGHYVNYRKQVSPSMQDLLPEVDFRLFAVSIRFPQGLARHIELLPVQPGVYEVRHFTGTLRLVVVRELPQQKNNALLHLFSARSDLVKYAKEHYELRSTETSTLLLQLFRQYELEVALMADALEEFARETIAQLLRELPPEERLKGLSPEERLKGLPPEERLKGLPPEERLKGLSSEELLAALSPEARAELVRRIRGSDAPKAGGTGG
jgi:hypothetical protein